MKRVYDKNKKTKKEKKSEHISSLKKGGIDEEHEITHYATSKGLSRIKFIESLESPVTESISKEWPYRFVCILRLLAIRLDDHLNSLAMHKKKGLRKFLKGEIIDEGMTITELTANISEMENLQSSLKPQYIYPILKTMKANDLIKVYQLDGKGNPKYAIDGNGKRALDYISNDKGPLRPFFDHLLNFREEKEPHLLDESNNL